MPTILITGATSGIGLEYAKYFQKRFKKSGCKLILTARRNKIYEIKKDLETENVKIDIIKADFSKKEDIKKLVSIIKKEKINVLINNAGFGNNIGFLNDCLKNQMSMIKTHIIATTKLTHTASRYMLKENKGVIINVSSLAALLPIKNSELYTATKSYILYFTKSIAESLKDTNIQVQCLCPGFVKTDFFSRKNTNKKVFMAMSAKDVIKESIKSLKKNKTICIPGSLNKIAYFYFKLFK